MAKDCCPYCGKEFTAHDWLEGNRFSHGGIAFHGSCRTQALENAKARCQEEIKQSLKDKKGG